MRGYCAVRRRRLIVATQGNREQVRAVERSIDQGRRAVRRRRQLQRQVLA